MVLLEKSSIQKNHAVTPSKSVTRSIESWKYDSQAAGFFFFIAKQCELTHFSQDMFFKKYYSFKTGFKTGAWTSFTIDMLKPSLALQGDYTKLYANMQYKTDALY